MADQQHARRATKRDQYLVKKDAHSYYAEVASQPLPAQSALIERLIDFAFGDLGAQHLEVRVADGRKNCCATC